jgi:hypothetical protein
MHEPPSSSTDTLTMELRDLVERYIRVNIRNIMIIIINIVFLLQTQLFRQSYEFWVSATTSIGEGERTTIVTQTTNTRGTCELQIERSLRSRSNF